MPAASHAARSAGASSMSMSGTISPSNPAAAASRAKRWAPIRSTIETLTMATSAHCTCARTARTAAKTPSGVQPATNASCMLSAITGPSAIGSLNGMPTSITRAPAAESRGSSAWVDASDGYPAVTNGSTAPVARDPAAKARATRLSGAAVVMGSGMVGGGGYTSRQSGPVAQRPTGDGKKQARNGKVSKGIPPEAFTASLLAWKKQSTKNSPACVQPFSVNAVSIL